MASNEGNLDKEIEAAPLFLKWYLPDDPEDFKLHYQMPDAKKKNEDRQRMDVLHSWFPSHPRTEAFQACRDLFSMLTISFFSARITFSKSSFQIMWLRNFNCHVLIAGSRHFGLPIILVPLYWRYDPSI